MRPGWRGMTPLDDTAPDPTRGRRANGGTPVADPGLAPVGADAEAGGTAGPSAPRPDHPRRDPAEVEAGGIGLRLTPVVWYGLAALIGALLLATLIASF
jgi:hypothetical protein